MRGGHGQRNPALSIGSRNPRNFSYGSLYVAARAILVESPTSGSRSRWPRSEAIVDKAHPSS